MPYDSAPETQDHIARVQDLIAHVSAILIRRGNVHDQTKLQPPEKALFDQYTPLLKTLTYNSPAYHDALAGLKVALDHHYATYGHHPQHWPNGINDMSLLDILEMFIDWKAATERHADGNLAVSIQENKKRFGMSDQLAQIFENTRIELGW